MMRPNGTMSDALGWLCAALAVTAGVLIVGSSLAVGTEATGVDAQAATTAAPPALPQPPADARAAKVYAVFDEFCARCHQTGKLQIPAPARPLANILAVDDVALDFALVKPGLPDASPLYTIMLRQHASVGLELPVAATQAVRDWIVDLPERGPNCGGRPKIGQAEVERAITSALATAPEDRRKDLRFVTLGHLADACAPTAALAGYRQAVAKALNSLSWGSEPIHVEAFGPDDTILQFNVAELGWVAAHWEKLVQGYPYASLAASRLSETIRRQTGTPTPAVRADWLAHATMATPLYARLLGLPGRMANLQRILNVDIDANIATAKARRAAVAQPAITRANRLVERHPTRIGSLWLAYDFATSEARQNLAANPLGPAAGGAVKVPFRHDGTRALFTLPNGFIAFSLNDARGDRLEAPADSVEREEVGWTGANTNAAGCLACHRSGPFAVKDMVRPQIEADTAAPKELRELILALYAPQSQIDGFVIEDQQRYADAQRKAGIDPTLLIDGIEPVAALAREYTRDVGLFRLAAEAGLGVDEVRKRLELLPPELSLSGLRILAATAPRAEADRLLVRLAPDAGSAEANVVVAQPPPARDDLELLLWSKSDTYEVGQLATFHARSNQNCYLTLISLDRGGQATVLFPNEFEQNNLLVAGKDLMLPAAGAAYQLRLREKGRETLIGICQTDARSPDGIQHDFERQRFTMLGDWRAYLGQVARGARAVAPGDPTKPRGPRVAKGNGAAVDPKAETKPAMDIQARTAIRYDIR